MLSSVSSVMPPPSSGHGAAIAALVYMYPAGWASAVKLIQKQISRSTMGFQYSYTRGSTEDMKCLSCVRAARGHRYISRWRGFAGTILPRGGDQLSTNGLVSIHLLPRHRSICSAIAWITGGHTALPIC